MFFKFTSFLILFSILFGCSPKLNFQEQYLGQKKPELSPQIFAKDLISKVDQSEFGSVFSKDGKEFFFGVDIKGRTEIHYCQFDNGEWTAPKTILKHPVYGYNDPFLSPDGQELYFISNRPLNGEGPKKDIDIWYVKRTQNGWSEPINAGPNINSKREEYYISFTNAGKMYFASNVNTTDDTEHNFDIYTSERLSGNYQPKIKLPEAINSKAYEADVFVAPDESYVIFCANRRSVGLGRGDLYISFKQADGTWSDSKNMGRPINSEKHELCPFVTADGKYLFYTSNQDIYWVSTAILEQYR